MPGQTAKLPDEAVRALAAVVLFHDLHLERRVSVLQFLIPCVQRCHLLPVLGLIQCDEGITGTSTKHREGFKQMVADALAGKIDLIVTKRVSRFARNTVDSLTTIRQLKENGIECYFEKENIWTFDGKGELLLTIMS